jgi:hypothetical protein
MEIADIAAAIKVAKIKDATQREMCADFADGLGIE